MLYLSVCVTHVKINLRFQSIYVKGCLDCGIKTFPGNLHLLLIILGNYFPTLCFFRRSDDFTLLSECVHTLFLSYFSHRKEIIMQWNINIQHKNSIIMNKYCTINQKEWEVTITMPFIVSNKINIWNISRYSDHSSFRSRKRFSDTIKSDCEKG